MSTQPTGNRLLDVASLAMRIGGKYVESYSHRNSPQRFTQRQLLTCLIMRAYLKTTYRGVIEILEVSDRLCAQIGLERLPHYTTLQKFAQRSAVLEVVDAMLCDVVREFAADDAEASMDSTGLETGAASSHYKTRSGKTKKRYVKLSVCIASESLLPSSLVVSWGPNNDRKEAPEVLDKARAVHQPQKLFADAGYDAEWVHEFCRDEWDVESFIKPVMHRKDGGLNGKYRSLMTEDALEENGYGRRWLVESFMSGLKRTTGSCLLSRKPHNIFVEAGLRVLAYALRRRPVLKTVYFSTKQDADTSWFASHGVNDFNSIHLER